MNKKQIEEEQKERRDLANERGNGNQDKSQDGFRYDYDD